MSKEIPTFESEGEEREFWATHVFELAREEGVTLLQPDEEYPIWTPYSAFDAATTLLTCLHQCDD